MSNRLTVLGIVVLLAILASLVIVEWPTEGPRRDALPPPSMSEGPGGPTDTSGSGIEPRPGSVSPSRTETAREATPPAPSGYVSVLGVLRGEFPGSIPELKLEGARLSRDLQPDDDGRFAFSVPEESFPLSVSSRGAVLHRFESPPPEGKAFLNVSLFPPTRENGGLIAPRAASARRDGEGTTLQLYGETRLSEGTNLILRVTGKGRTMGATMFSVEAGQAIVGELRLEEGEEIYSGEYDVEVAWKSGAAEPATYDEVRPLLDDPDAGEVAVRRSMFLGRESDQAVQEEAIRAFFEEALREYRRSRDLLLYFGTRWRGKRIRSLNEDPDRMAAVRSHDLFPRFARLYGGDRFDLEGWRSLLDEELPRRWERYRSPDAIPFPKKYPMASSCVPLLYQQLEKYSRLESRLVYEAFELSPDPRDFVDFDWGPEVERKQTLGRLRDFERSIVEELAPGRDGNSLFEG